MSSTLDFNVLIAEYEDEIRSWDWEMIIKWFDDHSDSPDYYEDNGYGDRFVYQWIGTVFGLTPSGKVYTFWTTNQTDEDVIRDSAWWEALEVVADEHGCFIGSPEDCGGGDDIFLCKRFDTPEEDDEDDDVS